MNNASKVIIAVVVVAVIGVGAFLLTKDDAKDSAAPEQSAGSQNESQSSGQSTPAEDETVAATITYDGNSFTVSTDAVKSGSKVKVVNNSETDLDLESDPHPVHTDNSELNAGDIAPGESRTFLLTTKGTWGFHNHLDSSQAGEITVE